ncbi:MAG: response regulator [Elusimicrobiota bacterium]
MNEMVKILIVEDDRDITEVLSMALNSEGYQVSAAYDGIEAMEKIKKTDYDIIILDLMLPNMDGHAVNLKLKENPKTAKIPVIVITGKGNLKELLGLREGVTVSAYFEKPVPIKLIKSKIKELL